MHRPRWHDWVIVLSLVLLGGAGVAALWGQEITGWFGGEAAPAPDDEVTPPSGGGRML